MRTSSKFIREIKFDHHLSVLGVKMVSGVYAYQDVPERIGRELRKSESWGKGFNALIKDKYEVVRLQGGQ